MVWIIVHTDAGHKIGVMWWDVLDGLPSSVILAIKASGRFPLCHDAEDY